MLPILWWQVEGNVPICLFILVTRVYFLTETQSVHLDLLNQLPISIFYL